VTQLYKNENGEPLILTPTQLKIFDLIFKRQHPRSHLMCHTRFGKSFVVGLAVLTRVASFAEKWAIVAPSGAKAQIIMSYIIEHCFDNEYTKRKLQIDSSESMDRLRRERSKSRLVFKHTDGTFGEVFILSADSRNKLAAGDALMGFGAPNVIEDEASLIDDDVEAKIFRMLGDQMDNFYLKIGNPFRRNHFLKAYRDPSYFKINADYTIGLAEGRLNEAFIEEVKKKPHFDVLYENKFPEADAIDDKGYSHLVTDKELEYSLDYITESAYIGERMLGVDIARGGGNFNVWVMRTGNFAKILGKNKDADLMSVVGQTTRLAKENKIDMRNVFTDDTGVGAGVSDRLREQRFYINAVKLGEKAEDELKFINKRAEGYWKLKQWLNQGGKLNLRDDWTELLDIKYRANSSSKLQIMSKDDMRRNGIESPDIADALMLTFTGNPYIPEVIRQQAEADYVDNYSIV